MEREDEIRLIAYNIWLEEGCSDGQDNEHWMRAETIWEQKQKGKTVIDNNKMEPPKSVSRQKRRKQKA